MTTKPQTPTYPLYFAMFQAERAHLLMTSHDGSIEAFATEQEAMDFFTKGYNRSHQRSYQGSMSACIHYIFFQPVIVRFDSDTALKAALEGPPYSLVTAHNIAGSMCGFQLKEEAVTLLKTQGTSVKLIS